MRFFLPVKELLKIPPAIAAYLALAGVIGGTMLAFGLIPQVFSGFAPASQFSAESAVLNAHITQVSRKDEEHWQALKSSSDQHWATQTAASLLQMDQMHCKLPHGTLRYMYDQLIQQRSEEYFHLTGHRYSLPDCGSL
jgi:hypothetical protein